MKSRFLQLFERYPDAMVIVDRAGQIHQANGRAEALFGYGHDKLRGESVQTLFPGQSVTLSGSPGPGDVAGHAGQHLDLVGSSSDLRQFPADVNVIPIQTERGTASVMSIRDITEAQRAQFVLDLGLNFEQAAGRDRQDLLDHLIRAQEEERGRIAADIHDDTIQMLAAANLRIQQLRNALSAPDEHDILDRLQRTLSVAMSHLRQLIFNLKPPNLEHGGVATALAGLLDDMKSDVGVSYQVDDRCTARLGHAAKVIIYRSASEALANVRKHARARNVHVKFLAAAGGCLVRVVDDGVGYNPAEVEQRPGHAGLTLIRERAEIAGGWSRIESAPGSGTTVEFWIPNHGLPGQSKARRDRVA
ncbi:MAG TPA: PAS domain-containing sensor histidine kinase [Streptosporangiaceae bacterium]|nr:PAS domain-containing sensor histidine kinase [Streptosporangiaceae bacterium]